MPGEESRNRKAEGPFPVELDLPPSCSLSGTAEEGEEVGAEEGSLACRMPRRGVAPVYRFPLLSASGGSAFAGAHAAPPGSGKY